MIGYDTCQIVVRNDPPVVSAGPDQFITMADNHVSLCGAASDDGLPPSPGRLSTQWTVASGPGTVMFADANSLSTTATFSAAGSYVLRLTASDSLYSIASDCRITVYPASHALYHVTDLGVIDPNQTPESWAVGMNNAGQVVGQATLNYSSHVFLFSNALMQDLGALSRWQHHGRGH